MFEELLKLNKSRRLNVLVVGDTLIDEYQNIVLQGVDYESGYPKVLLTDKPIRVPGGAGNAARQFSHWNCNVTLISLVDREAAEVLDDFGISSFYCIESISKIARKRRLLLNNRIYFQESRDHQQEDLKLIRSWAVTTVQERLPHYDVLLIADYGRTLLSEENIRTIIGAANKINVPVVADPHSTRELGCCTGATLIKVHIDRKENGQDSMVCTRGEHPPQLVNSLGTTSYTCKPRSYISPRNLIGAGDCFSAHLAIGLGYGISLPTVVELAYSASRCYVVGSYNEPVIPLEVYADIEPYKAKIVDSPEDLKKILDVQYTRGNKKVIVANGCFDMLHAGHVDLLTRAKQEGDILVVAVNSDDSVSRLKGSGRPVFTLVERLAILSSMSCVDYVISFSEDTPSRLLSIIKSDILVKGPDWSGRIDEIAGKEFIKELIILSPKVSQSTTSILSKSSKNSSLREIM